MTVFAHTNPTHLRYTKLGRAVLAVPVLLLIAVFTTGCESPADVDADRKIIREYDPSLTDIRLKIYGQQSKYFGRYSSEVSNLYEYTIENISGEPYKIQEIMVEWKDSVNDRMAIEVEHPPTPLTLEASGEKSRFTIGLSFIDIKLITEKSGSKSGRITVIGEIDTLTFDMAYMLPPLIIEVSDLSNIKQNSNIPVNLTFHNFSDSDNGLLRPSITPSSPDLTIYRPDTFPMPLYQSMPNNLQLLFKSIEIGTHRYTLPLYYQKRFSGAPEELEIEINVVK